VGEWRKKKLRGEGKRMDGEQGEEKGERMRREDKDGKWEGKGEGRKKGILLKSMDRVLGNGILKGKVTGHDERKRIAPGKGDQKIKNKGKLKGKRWNEK
jgi:hypothetical protein